MLATIWNSRDRAFCGRPEYAKVPRPDSVVADHPFCFGMLHAGHRFEFADAEILDAARGARYRRFFGAPAFLVEPVQLPQDSSAPGTLVLAFLALGAIISRSLCLDDPPDFAFCATLATATSFLATIVNSVLILVTARIIQGRSIRSVGERRALGIDRRLQND